MEEKVKLLRTDVNIFSYLSQIGNSISAVLKKKNNTYLSSRVSYRLEEITSVSSPDFSYL